MLNYRHSGWYGIRRLHRQLVRLNEAALMIDAQLGNPAAVGEGSTGQLLHQGLFDIELALTNIARFAEAMARMDLPEDQCAEVQQALRAIAHSDLAGAVQSFYEAGEYGQPYEILFVADDPGPVCSPSGPAMSRTRAPPSAEDSSADFSPVRF